MTRGPILFLVGLILTGTQQIAASGVEDPGGRVRADISHSRTAGENELRDAAQVAALIERLDAVRNSRDVLPLHALDLSLRKAVERELAEGQAELSRGRALRLQSAAQIGSGDRGLKRDEAYRAPVSSWADPKDAPPAKPPKLKGRKSSPAAEADFERRRRAVVSELSQLDGLLDDVGVNIRRDLLVQLLKIARERDFHRSQREAAE